MKMKLDEYIERNNLSQDDVYTTVLLIEQGTLRGHVSGEKELEIDQYAIHFLNDYYHISEIKKNKKKENDQKELENIEKSIIDSTFENLDVDNITYEDIDFSCKLDDKSSKKIEQETKKLIEGITEKVKAE